MTHRAIRERHGRRRAGITVSHVSFGMAMTIQAPFHEERVFTPRHLHLFDGTMARCAPDATMNVDAVIEVNKIGKVVDARPLKRPVFSVTCPNRFKYRTVGPDLRVAIHTRLGRRNSGKPALFDGRVAVAAINPDSRYMMLVAERHGLLAHHPCFGEVRRADQYAHDRRRSGHNQYRPENADFGESIRAAVKDLSHSDTTTALRPMARWVPKKTKEIEKGATALLS